MTDVLEPEGISLVQTACIEFMEDPTLAAEDATQATSDCNAAVGDSASFVLKDDGFNLLLDLGPTRFAFGFLGATVPWARLTGMVAPGAPSDFAAAHTKP